MPVNPGSYREEFPILRSCLYLNHAAVSPIPTRVRDAMAGLLDDVHLFGAAHYERWAAAIEAARGSAARLLNAEPQEVAFAKNTSEGISQFALGLEWQKGDEVVSVEDEFPANLYAWQALENRGVVLRLVRQKHGEFSLDSLERAFSSRTRVVALSYVQYLSGFRADLVALGALCAARGVLLCVDAIQGLGAFPLDVKAARIAALSADGHKWMFGPEGCGILFVREDLVERLRPRTVGWTSVDGWLDFHPRALKWRKGAARFECGTLNTVGIYGLGAALSLVHEAGVECIGEHILNLTERLRRGLEASGQRVYGPSSREHGSGIVSFSPKQRGADEVVARLLRRRIVASSRRGFVRISPHFYNTEAEIDRVLEALR